MTKLKSKLCFGIGAAALALATAFAVPADAGDLKMMFQGDPYEIDAISDAAKRFEAANAGTKIELIHVPHDSYNEKFGAFVSAKQIPDIVELDAPFLSNYVWSGYLQPISSLIDKDLLDDMTASNVSQGTYPPDGQLYATSLIDSTVMLYASKKQLAAVGARIPKGVDDAWTKDEFEALLAKLAKEPGVKWPIDLFRAYGTKTEWIPYGYEPILVSMGCDLIGRDTWKAEGTLDSKACVDALTMMQTWNKNGWVVPQSSGANQFYAEGRPAAIAWGGFWFYAEAAKAMGDDVLVLPLPNFGKKSASPNGTWIYSIAKSSSDPAMAGKFLSFMIKDKAYREAYKSHSGFPGLKTFGADSPLYAPGGPMAIGFEQAAKSAVPRPPHPAYPAITLATQVAFTNILDGADAQAELTKAAKAIDADIADNDGYPPFGK